jgi:hypothetical protein
LPDKQLRDVCVRAMPQIVAQGARHVGRQGQLSTWTCFRRRNGEGFESPVYIIDAEPGDFDGSQTQINQADGDGVVTSTLVGLAVKCGEQLSPLAFTENLRKPLVAEIGDRRYGKRQPWRALASQMHKTKKLPQNRERVIDALGTEDAAPQHSITTQILRWHRVPLQRSTAKLP